MTNTPQNVPGQFPPGFSPGFTPGFATGFTPQPFGTAVPEEPKPKMRWTWIKIGIGAAVIGLVALIAGGIMSLIGAGLSSLDPIAEGRTPGTATFTAEDREYDVLLVTGRREPAGSASNMECDVTLADGRTIHLDGSVQAVGSDVANTESIGSFDAVPGQTSVFCEADGTTGNRFVIDTDGLLATIATWALIAGGVLMAIGAGLILGGVFWKKQPQPAAV